MARNSTKIETGPAPGPAPGAAPRSAPGATPAGHRQRDAAGGSGTIDAGETREQALAGLRQLLATDERIRSARDETELTHLIVNEVRRLSGARQVFLLRIDTRKSLRIAAVSSLALVDRDTPLIRWVEGMVRRFASEATIDAPGEFTLPAYVDVNAAETRSYPFAEFVWQPLRIAQAPPFAGILAAREQPWRPDDIKLFDRLAAVCTSAWAALHGARLLRPRNHRRKWLGLAGAFGLLLAAFIPVPLTTLAPVEIVAHQPEVVTAPIDGVISEIPADPNRRLDAGAILFRYEDTTLRNRNELAEREMRVAQSRFERAARAALSDVKARHELLITKTEYELKKAERDYAASFLAKTIVRSRSPGMLIYTSRDDWLGRPVTTGEKIMSIARPGEIVARIELPVADAIALEKGAAVRLFLDASPLDALAAVITNESHHAEPNSSNQLVYTLRARLEETQAPGNAEPRKAVPRIGSRGTAQVFGATVPLAFFLLRRPIAYVRQTFGF